MRARLFVALQYLLPKHLLTALIWRIARIRVNAIKNFLITRFVTVYNVDTEDVKLPVPGGFATFNDFFVRELRDGTRPCDESTHSIVSPVDGTLSIAGSINDDTIVQAKGIHYTLQELLATDPDQAHTYLNGRFATIYLAPYNYHRVHAPMDGKLVSAEYLPGTLFSVNTATVSRVDGLFRRNERLLMHFSTNHGPMALIFVGALNVGSISTLWSGELRPRRRGTGVAIDLSKRTTTVKKGALLGWFNMGSTVIVLMPAGMSEWCTPPKPGETLKMGTTIAQLLVAPK